MDAHGIVLVTDDVTELVRVCESDVAAVVSRPEPQPWPAGPQGGPDRWPGRAGVTHPEGHRRRAVRLPTLHRAPRRHCGYHVDTVVPRAPPWVWSGSTTARPRPTSTRWRPPQW